MKPSNAMKVISKDAYLFVAGILQQTGLEVSLDDEILQVGAEVHALEDLVFELENHGNNTRITSHSNDWFILL